MKITDLLSEDFNDFNWLPGDIGEYIGRPDIKGIAAVSDFTGEPVAALIWQILVKLPDMSKVSRLICFYAPDTPTASALMGEYDARIKNEGVLLTEFAFSDIRSYKRKVLEENGFKIRKMPDESLCLTLHDLIKLKEVKKQYSTRVVPIGNEDKAVIDSAIDECIKSQKTDFLPDACYLPYEWYDPNVSCCMRRRNAVTGLLLVHRSGSGIMRPVLFRVFGECDKGDLMEMIRCSVNQAYVKYPLDTVISIPARQGQSQEIIDGLLPVRNEGVIFKGQRREND